MMVQNTKGLLHYKNRKNNNKSINKRSESSILVNFLDKIIYVIGIIGPIMTIPQIVKIWKYQNAQGVSVLSWMTYLFASMVWMIYGVVHKEKPIIVSYALWIILDFFVVLGAIIYS